MPAAGRRNCVSHRVEGLRSTRIARASEQSRSYRADDFNQIRPDRAAAPLVRRRRDMAEEVNVSPEDATEMMSRDAGSRGPCASRELAIERCAPRSAGAAAAARGFVGRARPTSAP